MFNNSDFLAFDAHYTMKKNKKFVEKKLFFFLHSLCFKKNDDSIRVES